MKKFPLFSIMENISLKFEYSFPHQKETGKSVDSYSYCVVIL